MLHEEVVDDPLTAPKLIPKNLGPSSFFAALLLPECKPKNQNRGGLGTRLGSYMEALAKQQNCQNWGWAVAQIWALAPVATMKYSTIVMLSSKW